jgi:hypothetical protein
MELDIDARKVSAVLLSDGEWHTVAPGSFRLGSYTFTGPEGQRYVPVDDSPIGFAFTEEFRDANGGVSSSRQVSGPLSALLVVNDSLEKF